MPSLLLRRPLAFVSALVHFVYTDNLPMKIDDHVKDLLKEAAIIRNERLRTLSTERLITQITR